MRSIANVHQRSHLMTETETPEQIAAELVWIPFPKIDYKKRHLRLLSLLKKNTEVDIKPYKNIQHVGESFLL